MKRRARQGGGLRPLLVREASLGVALAMGAFLGFSALWLVAVATNAGHGRARYTVWAVVLFVAIVAAAVVASR